jgi:predicted acetyltransferase
MSITSNNIYIKLVSFDDSNNLNIYNMLQDIDKEENGFINPGFGISKNDFKQFIEYLIKQKDEPQIDKGYVPQSVYWLFDKDEVIGFSKMRHYLNDFLKINGGHIGYGIRKQKRNMGYGKELLRLTLTEIAKLGINEVLLTCDSNNFGSINIIKNNGGILEKQIGEKCYFWIKK